MAVKIQVRRDTASNWTTANTVLDSGEIGFETDTNKFKIGDGSSAWSALPHFIPDSGVVAESNSITESDVIALIVALGG